MWAESPCPVPRPPWCQWMRRSGAGADVAAVLPQVHLQAAGAGESLTAVGAAVRLFARMRAFVFLHGVAVAEGAAAERTAVRTLARVDAQVAPQVPPLAEALGAEGAAVRTLTRVRAQVAPQVGRLRERLAAPVAGVRLPLLLQVEAEPGGLTEGFAAARAAVDQFRDVGHGAAVVIRRHHQRQILERRNHDAFRYSSLI